LVQIVRTLPESGGEFHRLRFSVGMSRPQNTAREQPNTLFQPAPLP
jgi:hypothetical protein